MIYKSFPLYKTDFDGYKEFVGVRIHNLAGVVYPLDRFVGVEEKNFYEIRSWTISGKYRNQDNRRKEVILALGGETPKMNLENFFILSPGGKHLMYFRYDKKMLKYFRYFLFGEADFDYVSRPSEMSKQEYVLIDHEVYFECDLVIKRKKK